MTVMRYYIGFGITGVYGGLEYLYALFGKFCPFQSPYQLFTSEIDVVGIDEAQFFDSGLIDVCNQLANNGIRVIVAGLDMDFRGIPFGPMPGLCAIADEVSKVHAICVKCGQLASFSHRTVKNDKQVLLGETEEYEPLCRECYQQAIQADQKESGHAILHRLRNNGCLWRA